MSGKYRYEITMDRVCPGPMVRGLQRGDSTTIPCHDAIPLT
jgi:hypothetical protein